MAQFKLIKHIQSCGFQIQLAHTKILQNFWLILVIKVQNEIKLVVKIKLCVNHSNQEEALYM